MADDQELWGYPEVAAHLGISVGATRNRKSRGSLPAPDDTTVPDRPPLAARHVAELDAGRPGVSQRSPWRFGL
ncbi:MarR family transcriptional regulator [Streptomyces sp. SPB162]|uniref:MarR family transcriptional regulator n=1 Tax=Streptomyces sp. SPB162 TaxID=2940560 RepID=UPI00240653DD|nr:MarR family transcriptional regulator [Streptomyces sp. SPB162]MDF9814009.1 hypothetical protein [Streptomyces sp. SPB162]